MSGHGRSPTASSSELPDLAVWLNGSKPPGAVIAESGGRREDRQKLIFEGWRDPVWSGRYLAVRYRLANPSAANSTGSRAWPRRLGSPDSAFTATVQTTAEKIAALSPATPAEPGLRRDEIVS